MPSPVNRARRKKAFTRGYERPQVFDPYRNPILDELWKRGREARLKKTGGVLPPPPQKCERHSIDQGRNSRSQPSRQQSKQRGNRW
jgi:hypothetical protein